VRVARCQARDIRPRERERLHACAGHYAPHRDRPDAAGAPLSAGNGTPIRRLFYISAGLCLAFRPGDNRIPEAPLLLLGSLLD
jgi:hypothetical protein